MSSFPILTYLRRALVPKVHLPVREIQADRRTQTLERCAERWVGEPDWMGRPIFLPDVPRTQLFAVDVVDSQHQIGLKRLSQEPDRGSLALCGKSALLAHPSTVRAIRLYEGGVE